MLTAEQLAEWTGLVSEASVKHWIAKGISRETVTALANHIAEQERRIGEMRQALELIAAPKRPDGTYNRCREACEQIAKAALSPTTPATETTGAG